VIREPVTLPQHYRISLRSSARFFHLVDVIAGADEPTATQLSALERSHNSTGEFLSACPGFQGDLIQIHAHGSRQLGTIVRLRDGSREGFDIDLIAGLASGARHEYDGEHGPALLLDRSTGCIAPCPATPMRTVSGCNVGSVVRRSKRCGLEPATIEVARQWQ
jgi:hypothetical protein